MTTTEITVRAHKRKKPAKQPDPLQTAINARLAERQQRKSIVPDQSSYHDPASLTSWIRRMFGRTN